MPRVYYRRYTDVIRNGETFFQGRRAPRQRQPNRITAVPQKKPPTTMSSPPSSQQQQQQELLCDGIVSTRRGLLALLWSLVMVSTAVAFLAALLYTIGAPFQKSDNDDDDHQNQQQNEGDPALAVTTRAMAFAALWTAVLASLLSVFGTVILGWQSPTGQYYTCCSSSVFRTTRLGVGSFIGLLIMFANLTLVCSVFFGEFQVSSKRDGSLPMTWLF